MTDSVLLNVALIVGAIVIGNVIYGLLFSPIRPYVGIRRLIRRIEKREENHDEGIVLILNKYHWQRRGITPISPMPDDISEDRRKRLEEYTEWEFDGKPTGIRNDRTFFALQKYVFGRVIWKLDEPDVKKSERP